MVVFGVLLLPSEVIDIVPVSKIVLHSTLCSPLSKVLDLVFIIKKHTYHCTHLLTTLINLVDLLASFFAAILTWSILILIICSIHSRKLSCSSATFCRFLALCFSFLKILSNVNIAHQIHITERHSHLIFQTVHGCCLCWHHQAITAKTPR